jgi:membrane-associated phospholipid phosphatase
MGLVSAARRRWGRVRATKAREKGIATAIVAASRGVHLANAVGLELLAGLLILTGSAWVFGWMVEDLAEGDTKVDHRFANWLHEHATPAWTAFFENVTRLGNVPTLVVVVVLTVIVLWRKRLFEDLVLMLLAAVGTEVITIGLKLGFERDRPFFADPLASESSYSFPSGHASVSLAVYGTLGFIAARHLRNRVAQVAALAGATTLVLLIGFSRLYLGVHFLSDVIAGFSLGLAWVTLCALLLHLRVRLKKRRRTSREFASTKQ